MTGNPASAPLAAEPRCARLQPPAGVGAHLFLPSSCPSASPCARVRAAGATILSERPDRAAPVQVSGRGRRQRLGARRCWRIAGECSRVSSRNRPRRCRTRLGCEAGCSGPAGPRPQRPRPVLGRTCSAAERHQDCGTRGGRVWVGVRLRLGRATRGLEPAGRGERRPRQACPAFHGQAARPARGVHRF